jgi:hypothetical protein
VSLPRDAPLPASIAAPAAPNAVRRGVIIPLPLPVLELFVVLLTVEVVDVIERGELMLLPPVFVEPRAVILPVPPTRVGDDDDVDAGTSPFTVATEGVVVEMVAVVGDVSFDSLIDDGAIISL